MDAQSPVRPVILCGGSGTRLWPLSRPEEPKQLLALTGERTMLQMTADRVGDGARFEPPIVVCGARHADQVRRQLTEIGASEARLIVEPAARNTAPAIALAAASVEPETVLLVMPSDHVLADVAAFHRVIDRALPVARAGWLVTFGIEPDRPETGYGYIRRGEVLSDGVHKVDRFVEKPDLERAKAYLAEGDCSWNGGIFLFRAGDYVAALEAHAREVLDAARTALQRGRTEDGAVYPDADAFAASPSISIDYAVMEKVGRAAVAPVEMGWSDIGSWDALHDFAPKDANGNVLGGDVLALDTEGSLVRTTGPLVATVGIRDLIVLATRDAVVVLPRGESQRVKEIVEQLESRNRAPAE